MDTSEHIPQLVSKTVRQIDPNAEVVLFGSQARGDSHDESDWDFLIISDKLAQKEEKRKLRSVLLDIELEQEIIISQIVMTPNDWKNSTGMPLHEDIINEGQWV